jgi:hypothetical protein
MAPGYQTPGRRLIGLRQLWRQYVRDRTIARLSKSISACCDLAPTPISAKQDDAHQCLLATPTITGSRDLRVRRSAHRLPTGWLIPSSVRLASAKSFADRGSQRFDKVISAVINRAQPNGAAIAVLRASASTSTTIQATRIKPSSRATAPGPGRPMQAHRLLRQRRPTTGVHTLSRWTPRPTKCRVRVGPGVQAQEAASTQLQEGGVCGISCSLTKRIAPVK